MTLKNEQEALLGIIDRMLTNLLASITIKNSDSAKLRAQIGALRVDAIVDVSEGVFLDQLGVCFDAAYVLPVALSGLTKLHDDLLKETATGEYTDNIVGCSLVICMATESKLISGLVFKSLDDANATMQTMTQAFSSVGERVVEFDDPSIYLALIKLQASVTAHLASTARPLPRIVTFDLPTGLPALALSNRIYYDPSRWEEIVDENKIVHPAFCPREIRGLAS